VALTATIPANLLSNAGTAQIAVQDANGVLSNQVTFTIRAGVAVMTPTLAGGTVGTPYSDTLKATGGNSQYSWTLIGGVLPKGLGLASSGTVSGVPTEPGTFGFTAQATDATGAVASVLASVVVKPTALGIITGTLPYGYVNLEYPKQILEASGGVAPYTFAITAGALPAGLTLSNGVITGVPTTYGASNFTITVTDATATAITSDTLIIIYPASSDLEIFSGSVSFSTFTGQTELPPAQTVGIQSTTAGTSVSYTFATKNAPWLSVTGGGAAPGSLTVSLTPVALAQAVGTQTTNITVTCTSGACAGKTQNVAVSLVVGSAPAQLSVANSLLAFTSSTTPAQTQSQPLGIQNKGGGLLTVTSITCEAPWCAVGTIPATAITAGSTAQILITVNPSKLSTGFFRTTIDIATSAGNASVPVNFFVSSSPNMNLAPAGMQYIMQAGAAPGNPSGSFLVSAAGGTLGWSAAVLPGSSWLTLSTASGTATDGTPGTVSYAINTSAANLAAGAYYGTIEVKAPGALNSVQDYQVILIVTPATDAAKPDPQPAGLLFLTTVGGTAPQQTISIYAGSKTPTPFSASVNTDTGAWLAVSTLNGVITSDAPVQSTIGIGTAGLKQGVYHGSVNYASAGAGVRSVNVTLIVQPSGGGAATPSIEGRTPNTLAPRAACAPNALTPTQTGLVSNFAVPTLWPTPLAVTLYNDCGVVVPNGQVVVTFSNGDAPVLLTLANAAIGLYSGTWIPRNSAAHVTLSARATAPGLDAVTTSILGSVVPNVAPTLISNSVVNPFNPYQVGGPLAPGAIVAMYGSNLASAAGQPTATPLPTSISGTKVLIGGIASPLFYVGPGQVNAQIPFELDPAKQYQVIVNANGALTAPQTIQLTAAAPGVNAFADGTLVAFHAADGTLVSQTSPARPSEFIVIYLLGMGLTDNPVTTGDVSPGNPLAHPSSAPIVTLAGNPVPAAFVGLTPSLVGLYQINLQIPDVAADGNLVLTVSQNGVVSNTTILPVRF
jgi:uncharacterized protein (TIGR03437 family)